jgi:two-component system NarL family sensor kinase
VQSARIAGVLHDDVSQVLASAHVVLNDISDHVSAAAQSRLVQVQRHLTAVSDQLRLISRTLHAGIVDDLGLDAAVGYTARVFSRRTGVPVGISGQRLGPVPAAAAAVIFRVVEEALANVEAHAQATAVSIVFDRDRSRVTCTVADDGVGFDAAAVFSAGTTPRLGLTLVRARVEAAGGTFGVLSACGDGTRLRCTIPVEL